MYQYLIDNDPSFQWRKSIIFDQNILRIDGYFSYLGMKKYLRVVVRNLWLSYTWLNTEKF